MSEETEFTDRPVCPHCGTEERDWWEWGLVDGEPEKVTCGSCCQDFIVMQETTVYFCTEKPESEAE